MVGSGSYGADCDLEYVRRLATPLATFATHYKKGKPTIILFPGGTGSQLRRDNWPRNPAGGNYLSWYGWRLLNSEALNLAIEASGEDYKQHFVVPNGATDFIVQPYRHFTSWCASKGIQLFILGFDWRRSAQYSARFFIDHFLPAINQAIGDAGTGPYLSNYTLVGHSSGGMVVKLIVGEAGADAEMRSAITVGTPFYGYGAQIHKLIDGIPWLGWTLADPRHQDRHIAELTGTMPGGYEFLYLSEQTYADNLYAFQNKDDPDFRLPSYPCTDLVTGKPADPYRPKDTRTGVRYPLFGNAQMQLLSAGLAVAQDVAKQLPPAVAAKFYNIRGVQADARGRVKKTAVSSTWSLVPTSFDPDAARDPIKDKKGYGDGVQPAWGTRLLQLLDAPYSASTPPHVITVEGNVEHVFLMEDTEVQDKIAAVLGLPKTKKRRPWKLPPMASSKEYNDFLRKMPRLNDKQTPRQRRDMLAAYLHTHTSAERTALCTRAFTDLLKTP